MVLPFSIFVISGILLFYFPTIQTRIDELDDLIDESNDDFKVYSETIQDFSGHLFDFSRFDDRRGSYVEYAKDRRDWAIEKLQLAFLLLISVWGGLAVVSIIGYPWFSGQFLIAASSVAVAYVIWYRHYDADYYPNKLKIPHVNKELDPLICLIILIIAVTAIRLVISPIIIDEHIYAGILQEILSQISSRSVN